MTKKVILIPFWIERVFNREGLPLNSILKFDVLSKLLHRDDMAAIIAFQNYKRVNFFDSTAKNNLLDCWERNGNDGVELVSTLIPLANDEKAMTEYLEGQMTIPDTVSACDHKVIDFDREYVGIVIGEDFILRATNTSKRIKVFEDILRVVYNYMEKHLVSTTELYRNYVKENAVYLRS